MARRTDRTSEDTSAPSVAPDAAPAAAATPNPAKPPARKPAAGKSLAPPTAEDELPPGYRPSETEPFMGTRQKIYFRRKLMTWREQILREGRETLQTLHDDTQQHADITDRATSEIDKSIELRARDRQRKLVSKIDAALARIEDGTYGYCEETGEPIGLKRLDARPVATLSLEAQESHESRERVYRDDRVE